MQVAAIGLRAPSRAVLRGVPAAPGSMGQLVRAGVRQMFTVLDTYLAILVSAVGSVFGREAGAGTILALLVVLALSTYTQSLFALDGAAGATRYRLLGLRGWQMLLAKDAAWLGLVLVLTLPLDAVAGLTFGFTALAVGHYPSVALRLPVRRWRFTGGRLVFGIAQSVVGTALAVAGRPYLAVAAGLWLVSLYGCGRLWDGRKIAAARLFQENGN